jgi:lipopolysaccharide heptosyltransferase II
LFSHLQLSDPGERWAVGLADTLLSPVAAFRRLTPGRRGSVEPTAVLLLRLERIGDLVMTLEAIQAVRTRAPRARVELVVGSWNEPLARLIPGLDRIETLDAAWLSRGSRGAGWGAVRRAARGWRARGFDLAINFEGDIRSNLLLWLSGAKRRVGFSMAGGGPFLTDSVTYDPASHVAVNSMRLVEQALGTSQAAIPHAGWNPPRVLVPAEARARAAELIGLNPGNQPLVGIHASGGREIKQWAPERFAEVAAALARSHSARIYLTGSDADRALVDRVKAAWPGGPAPVDLCGDLDLITLAAVLERLTVFVTGDTGPMHLAAAVGTPIVAVYGPSDPARWGPLSASGRLVRVDLPCSPCNRIRRPPTRCVGHTPDCLAAITASRVVEEVVSVIEGRRSGGGPDGR